MSKDCTSGACVFALDHICAFRSVQLLIQACEDLSNLRLRDTLDPLLVSDSGDVVFLLWPTVSELWISNFVLKPNYVYTVNIRIEIKKRKVAPKKIADPT